MREAVILKSYQNGIAIKLNPEVPFEKILEELSVKFTQSKAFFGSSKVAVSLEGREVSDEEEIRILDTINACSDVKVICIVGRDEKTNRLFLKALKNMEKRLSGDEEGKFYRGSLKNHESLETETSIIILGDVHPGCSVVSAKNIIILGGLYGKAYAGANGDEEHYIVALEMAPESLTIGDFKYQSKERHRKKLIQPRIQPKIAFVKNRRIMFEPLTKELLDTF